MRFRLGIETDIISVSLDLDAAETGKSPSYLQSRGKVAGEDASLSVSVASMIERHRSIDFASYLRRRQRNALRSMDFADRIIRLLFDTARARFHPR